MGGVRAGHYGHHIFVLKGPKNFLIRPSQVLQKVIHLKHIVTYDPTYKPSSNPSNSHPAHDHRSIVSLSCGDSGLASANSLQVTPVSVHVHPQVTGSRRFIWNRRGRNQMRLWSILAQRLCKEHSSRVNVMFGLPPST